MIHRRFFWLLDLLVLCAAFLKAYALSPFLYVWLSLAPTCLFAPVAGLGLILLILFALKALGVSLMFVFSFTILSSVGLAVYLLVFRFYFNRRLAGGYYDGRSVIRLG